MSLSGQQRQKLQEALINAFPDKLSLEQMLSFQLDKKLDKIAGGSNLADFAFNLIKKAEAENWIKNLISAAIQSNPDNQLLKDIAAELLSNYQLVPATSPSPKSLPQRTQQLKILILAASPTDTPRLRLDEEIRKIEEGLRLGKERDSFSLEQRLAVRAEDLRRALLNYKPQIVHFCGHGETDGIFLENEAGTKQLVPKDALANLFKLFAKRGVQCVVLNACYSDVQAEEISQYINFVVGMSKAVGDQTAIQFAVGFYDGLGAGWSYEEAYELGCNAIALSGIPEELTPVLKKKVNQRICES